MSSLKRSWTSWKDALPLALVVFVNVRWPSYLRMRSAESSERKLFSFVHYDISPLSWWVNELLSLVFCFLLALVLIDARKRAAGVLSLLAEEKLNSRIRAENAYNAVVQSYSYWKVTSLGLALPFLYHTYVYWELIGGMDDLRYLASALPGARTLGGELGRGLHSALDRMAGMDGANRAARLRSTRHREERGA